MATIDGPPGGLRAPGATGCRKGWPAGGGTKQSIRGGVLRQSAATGSCRDSSDSAPPARTPQPPRRRLASRALDFRWVELSPAATTTPGAARADAFACAPTAGCALSPTPINGLGCSGWHLWSAFRSWNGRSKTGTRLAAPQQAPQWALIGPSLRAPQPRQRFSTARACAGRRVLAGGSRRPRSVYAPRRASWAQADRATRRVLDSRAS